VPFWALVCRQQRQALVDSVVNTNSKVFAGFESEKSSDSDMDLDPDIVVE
jgi:hypothetical protein